MKPIYFIMAFVCLALSCQKQSLQSNNDSSYLEVVKKDLQQRLTSEDFTNLDFSHAIFSKVDSIQLYLLQIPFIGVETEFVVIKTNVSGKIEKGKVIQLDRKLNDQVRTSHQYDGAITIHSLSRIVELQSAIEAGFIK